jgi:hypothetical protein
MHSASSVDHRTAIPVDAGAWLKMVQAAVRASQVWDTTLSLLHCGLGSDPILTPVHELTLTPFFFLLPPPPPPPTHTRCAISRTFVQKRFVWH